MKRTVQRVAPGSSCTKLRGVVVTFGGDPDADDGFGVWRKRRKGKWYVYADFKWVDIPPQKRLKNAIQLGTALFRTGNL